MQELTSCTTENDDSHLLGTIIKTRMVFLHVRDTETHNTLK
jgi:hypothetical protein